MTLPPAPPSPPAPRLPADADHRRFGAPSFWLLFTGAALLYLWGLGASGWANAFYSAAAQAGSQSWSAFFFGASDAAGSITVDKPPLALWPMALSVKVFGLSTWSLMLPQALAGLGTLALVHDGVRRATGSRGAALLAGVAFTLTPVAVLMFRFNNPDALLTLLLTGAAYATLRAAHSPRGRRWLVLAGVLVGLAFLTKMMQGFLVLPALALTYLVHAAASLRRRLLDLVAAFAAMVVAGSWWVLAVELWPASSRPYVGGSQHNSVLELVLGYNGFGRLTGDEVGAVHGGRGWGANTVLRLLSPSSGSQVSWLLPAAVVLSVTAVVLLRRHRTGPAALTAALHLWLAITGTTWLTFSLMAGIYHPYYTVVLSPAVASLLGLGAHVVWRHREARGTRVVLAGAVLATATQSLVLVWPALRLLPWLPGLVAIASVVACWRLVRTHRRAAPIGVGFAAAALLAAFASPTAYSLATVRTPHSGAVPKAGPDLRALRDPVAASAVEPAVGGLLMTSTPSPALVDLLARPAVGVDGADQTWAAAVVGSNSAAGFQLATGRPVMPVGGFNGTDPSPTLAEFVDLVRAGRIGYYLAGGGRNTSQLAGSEAEVFRSGRDESQRIESWVSGHFTATVLDGVVLYDLRAPKTH